MRFDAGDRRLKIDTGGLRRNLDAEGTRWNARRAQNGIDGQDESGQADKRREGGGAPSDDRLAAPFGPGAGRHPRVAFRRPQQHARRLVAGGFRARLVEKPALAVALDLGEPQAVQIERGRARRRLGAGTGSQRDEDRQHGGDEHRGEDQMENHGPF